MTPFATTIVIAGLLLLLSGYLFLRGIVRKNLRIFIWSIALLLIACGIGLYGVVMFLKEKVDRTITISKVEPLVIRQDTFVSYIADPKRQDIQLYWKDDSGHIFRSIQRVRDYVSKRNEALVFAMNGGMYQEDNKPLGLFIQDGRVVTRLNTRDANGNFYMKPNGVLCITRQNKAFICKTEDFINSDEIKYATQSGPMLLVDGAINKNFAAASVNRNIRNGVGVLPDGRLLFAMSKQLVTFFEFATFFKEQGCMNALYLDGFVSRTYLPEQKWVQTDGDFGVIIGCVVKR